jgi:hypothetical protein
MHVEDLIAVERQLGYRYEIEEAQTQHYQWICPACRRALLCLAHTALRTEPRKNKPQMNTDEHKIRNADRALHSLIPLPALFLVVSFPCLSVFICG